MSRPTLRALARESTVGTFWEPLKRRVDRERIAELSKLRFSSFPFISPDTFRAVADVVIEGQSVLSRRELSQRSIVYFDLALVSGKEESLLETDALRLLAAVLEGAESAPVLVMSHGDFPPSRGLVAELKGKCEAIYSVNVVEEFDNVYAIPLGIENFLRDVHGGMGDFLAYAERRGLADRSNEVFAAFTEKNNYPVRSELAKELLASRFDWNPAPLGRKEYRSRIAESMFVLSPPGIGNDCYRTWEAIYLGAIPVVLEGTLAPRLIENLPIHKVKNYGDFLSLGREEILELFVSLSRRRTEMAFMPYWVREMMGVSSRQQSNLNQKGVGQ